VRSWKTTLFEAPETVIAPGATETSVCTTNVSVASGVKRFATGSRSLPIPGYVTGSEIRRTSAPSSLIPKK